MVTIIPSNLANENKHVEDSFNQDYSLRKDQENTHEFRFYTRINNPRGNTSFRRAGRSEARSSLFFLG